MHPFPFTMSGVGVKPSLAPPVLACSLACKFVLGEKEPSRERLQGQLLRARPIAATDFLIATSILQVTGPSLLLLSL